MSVRTGDELLELLHTGMEQTGVSGTSGVVQIHHDREQQPKQPSTSIVGIRGYYLVKYEWKGPDRAFSGLRCFTSEGIGEGKFYSAEDVARMRGFEYDNFDAVVTRSAKESMLRIGALDKTKSVIKSESNRNEAFNKMMQTRREKAEKPSRAQLLEEKLLEGALDRGGHLCKHCNSLWLSPKSHRSHESECQAEGGLLNPASQTLNLNPKP